MQKKKMYDNDARGILTQKNVQEDGKKNMRRA